MYYVFIRIGLTTMHTTIVCVALLMFSICFYLTSVDEFSIDSGRPGPTVLMIAGTHGNEPAGTVFMEELMRNRISLRTGKIMLVPRLNKIGLLFNQRLLYHRLDNADLNRNYPISEKEEAVDIINKKVVQLVQNSDFIVDFHEAWGFHKQNKKSMGSGLYPSETKLSKDISNEIIHELNKTISNPQKKFQVGYVEDSDMKLNTLRNHATYMKKHYILVETSGQNDIQPLSLRVNQNKIITHYLLQKLGML